jgi:hypothetical protein
MRRSIIALGALITAASIQMATPARANANLAVCRSGGGEGGTVALRCDYATFEQCQATTAGLGGSCVMNPYPSNANTLYGGPARHHR